MINALNEERLREMNASERAVIRCLLSVDFKGRDNIRKQLGTALVRQIDQDGSLEFRIVDPVRADVCARVPVEGWYDDVNGLQVQVLLHVVDGIVKELEIYRVDGGNIELKLSAVEEITVFCPEVPGLLRCSLRGA
jgi:hypothetical protein